MSTGAEFEGDITSQGDATPDERGFVWDTSSHSDPGSSTSPSSSSYANSWTETGSFGTGVFTQDFSNLTEGTIYVRAVAHNLAGWDYGAEVSFTTAPEEPTSLSASGQSGDQIDLTWTDNSSVEDGFKIYRAQSSNTADTSNYTQIDTVGANTTSYSDTGLEDGELYYYRVAAYNSNADSLLSNENGTSTYLPAPSNQDATDNNGEAVITWTNNDDSSDGDILILKSTDGGSTYDTMVQGLGVTTTSYTDTNVSGGNTYYYRVGRRTDHSTSYSGATSVDIIAPPSAPNNVSATVNGDDSITVSWDEPNDWGGDTGQYEVQISKDETSYVQPYESKYTVNHDGSASYSTTITSDSDTAYDSFVGIDSDHQFRVQAENSAGGSSWSYSGRKYTTPIPPHNPTVSRPDANTFEISWENQSDVANIVCRVDLREDTGSGYGNWQSFKNVNSGTSTTISVGDSSTWNSFTVKEDARYQIRLSTFSTQGSTKQSEYVYPDYGNDGNVYFEDDFESGDLSAWDDIQQSANVTSNGNSTCGINGSDEGTYHCELNDSGHIKAQLPDLSNESDVIVKCAFAAGSLDNGAEEAEIFFYDGSSYQELHNLGLEYNKQGWVEVTAKVPDSWLSSSPVLYIRQAGGNADYTTVDRVVVSDILHEYTKPAAPSSLSLDNSVEDEITANFTTNANFSYRNDLDYKKDSTTSWTNGTSETTPSSSLTQTGLDDGEAYDIRVRTRMIDYRHGSNNGWFSSGFAGPANATTVLPKASGITLSPGVNDITVSWTDNADAESGFKVYYQQDGDAGWTQFSDVSANTTSETITGLNQDTKYNVYVKTYTEDTSAGSGSTSTTTYLDTSRSVNSHVGTIDSTNTALIDVTTLPASHTSAMGGSSSRGSLDYETRTPTNYLNPINSRTITLVNLSHQVGSHTGTINTFAYNERTSLELIDFTVTWDENETAWYTQWEQKTHILGNEDTLALRGFTVDGAKEPAAVIYVQYSTTDDGTIDKVSDPIKVGHPEKVYEVEGVPVDEDGWYRLKITQYSGYNSLYSLAYGPVH